MSYQGTTSNKEITEEGMNLVTTSGNDVELVTVFGKWELGDQEKLFKESKVSIIVVSKYVTLKQISDILCSKFDVNQDFNGLKLEVYKRDGSPWFPIIEIKCDEDLLWFISKSSKTECLLCVTVVSKDDIAGGVKEDEINPDIKEESPHGGKENEINPDIKVESPHGHKDDWVERRLVKAIEEGNKVIAREIIDTNNTTLHFVVSKYKDNKFVWDILEGINRELLVTTANIKGQTLAHTAALYGNKEALKIMVGYKPECIFIPDNKGSLAIHNALVIPKKQTFLYLLEQMKRNKDKFDEFLRGTCGLKLLGQVIDTELIDVAYELINDFPSLATTVYKDKTALERIIRKPELFYSGTHYNFFSKFVYHAIPIKNNSFVSNDTADEENQETPKKDKFVTEYTKRCLHGVISRIWVKLWETAVLHVPHVKRLREQKVNHHTTIELLERICDKVDKTHTLSDIKRLYSPLFCLAVENNTDEAVKVLATYFTELYNTYQDVQDIIKWTVSNHSKDVYISMSKNEWFSKFTNSGSIDKDGNNILHLAGRLAPLHKLNAVSGAALQMQQELQWFEEVKKGVGRTQRRVLNKNKETPMMVFSKQHEDLRKEGEEWMKKTADSYTITAALIITIVFAAAITVPGGNDNATGKPIYETKASLIIFAISDAISLFTSTTSLLWFLSILTSRYADEDFLYKLPKRLIFGLVMLFVSVTSMMIAFSATLYIMFGQGKPWILFPIAALACLPIASFVTLQFPLLAELISSTYGLGIFGKERDHRL